MIVILLSYCSTILLSYYFDKIINVKMHEEKIIIRFISLSIVSL